MNAVDICNKCATSYNSSTNNETTERPRRQFFGKSCLLNSVESSNQQNCSVCNNPLTDNEISEIKPIPLQERAISVSKQATRLFGRTISRLAPLFALGIAAGTASATLLNVAYFLSARKDSHGVVDGVVDGVAERVVEGVVDGAAGALVSCATLAVGAAVGSLGAATGVNRPAVKAAAGACGALGVVQAYRTIETAGFVAGSIGDAAQLGANSAETVTETIFKAVAGAIVGTQVTDYVFEEQENMNSEKKSL